MAEYIENGVRLGWLLDPLTALMCVMVTFVGLLIFIFSTGYMKEDANFTRFFCFLSLFAAAMLGLLNTALPFALVRTSVMLAPMCSRTPATSRTTTIPAVSTHFSAAATGLPAMRASTTEAHADEVTMAAFAAGGLPLVVLVVPRAGHAPVEPYAITPYAPDEEVVDVIGKIVRPNPDKLILVNGDAAVPYERVARGMALLQEAGARKVGFVTEPREDAPAR